MGVVWCCGSCLLATCFGIHSLHFARDGAQRCCAPTGACVVATAHSQIGCATFSAKKREKSRGFRPLNFLARARSQLRGTISIWAWVIKAAARPPHSKKTAVAVEIVPRWGAAVLHPYLLALWRAQPELAVPLFCEEKRKVTGGDGLL